MAGEVKPFVWMPIMRPPLPKSKSFGAPKRVTPSGRPLDVLATLIEAYRDRAFPHGPAGSIEAIKFGWNSRVARKDLDRSIGTRTRVAEVLNRKRNLSIAMIRRLSSGARIRRKVLIQPTKEQASRLRPKHRTAGARDGLAQQFETITGSIYPMCYGGRGSRGGLLREKSEYFAYARNNAPRR